MFTTLVSKVFDYANAGRARAALVIASTAAGAVAFTAIRVNFVNFIVFFYAVTSNFRWPIAAASATVMAISFNATAVAAFPATTAAASYAVTWQ